GDFGSPLAIGLGFLAGLVGAALGFGAFAGFFSGAARLFNAAGLFGFLARLFGLAGFFDLLGNRRVQIGDQARQALVITPQLVGFGALGGDLPFQLRQQRGAFFLLPDQ